MPGPKNEDSDSAKAIETPVKQVPFRMPVSEYGRMRDLLKSDGMNYQWFVNACIEAYLDRDPRILIVAKEWLEKTRPNKQKASKTFTARERRALMDEIQLNDLEPWES